MMKSGNLCLALWTSGTIWYQLTQTAGANLTEFVFLGVLAPFSWALDLQHLSIAGELTVGQIRSTVDIETEVSTGIKDYW